MVPGSLAEWEISLPNLTAKLGLGLSLQVSSISPQGLLENKALGAFRVSQVLWVPEVCQKDHPKLAGRVRIQRKRSWALQECCLATPDLYRMATKFSSKRSF